MTPSTRHRIAAACVAALMAVAYSIVPLSVPGIDLSPDENANRAFATMFATNGHLWRFDPLNLVVEGGLVHPRSVAVIDHFQVPGGFIGLPVLYGALMRAFGAASLPFLTPVVAVLAALAWGALLARFFDRRLAWTAAFLLAVQPAWWYTASRTLQPNVLFAALCIFAAWAFFTRPVASAAHRRGWTSRSFIGELALIDTACAGVALAGALMVRPSEAYWIALGAGVLLLMARDRVVFVRAVVCAAFALLALVPYFLLQQSLYGSALATGYALSPGTDVAGAGTGGRGARLLGPLRPYLFPLGFAPRAALAHLWSYGIAFFWWWTVLVAAGCWMIGKDLVRASRAAQASAPARWWHRAQAWMRRIVGAPDAVAPGETAAMRRFLAMAAVVAVWLVFFYGSWTIRDNPDSSAVTIGSSYLRYWLPVFVFSTVPVAALFVAIAGRVRGLAMPALLLCCAGVAIVAGIQVHLAPQEGLGASIRNLRYFETQRAALLAATDEKSLLVVDRADKFLWPQRSVVVPLRSESTYAALPMLSKYANVHYFGITFPDRDLAWLRSMKLAPLGLTIEPVMTLGEETLYRFRPATTP